MAPNLTPEWLEFEKSIGARPRLEGTIEQILEQYQGLGALLAANAPPPDPEVLRREQDADGVRCVIYSPAIQGDALLPVVVYFHGGGFALGAPEEDYVITELIAKHTPAVVVSVDYRLAPAHKHPAALDDCATAYKWAWSNAESLGGDRGRFVSMGGSAGGGLALGVVNRIVADPAVRADHVKGCVAIVPIALHPENVPAEYQSMYKAHTENAADVPVINSSSMITFYETAGADPKDAANFVGLASENHQYFPPTYFAACELDPLRDDAMIMEKMLSKAGVKTKLDYYKSLPHYFWIFPGIPEAAQYIGNMLAGIKFVLE